MDFAVGLPFQNWSRDLVECSLPKSHLLLSSDDSCFSSGFCPLLQCDCLTPSGRLLGLKTSEFSVSAGLASDSKISNLATRIDASISIPSSTFLY
jgi:hypothetical protein